MALLSSTLRPLRAWGECALNLAFPWPASEAAPPVAIEPPLCARCGLPLHGRAEASPTLVCAACTGRRWYFQWARSGYRTQGRVLEAVSGFKYAEAYYQLPHLLDWLTETFDRYAAHETWDALVPVPLYHRRRRERGFNQAEELARGLGKRRKLPVRDCLYRCRETPSQTGLDKNERWENMADAFRLKPRFDAKGQNLLLIDDVFTTGATTNACAKVLAQAGAGRLAVLTIARS